MQTTQRRQQIDFLKSCRARLSPAAVGLPDTSRRRTPGLRREDRSVERQHADGSVGNADLARGETQPAIGA